MAAWIQSRNSSFVVEEFVRGQWLTIGIYVFLSLQGAHVLLEHYRRRNPSTRYRIVETVTTRQRPKVVAVIGGVT